MTSAKETAEQTLPLLEERLRRVDFLINGDNAAAAAASTTRTATATTTTLTKSEEIPPASAPASARLRNLERTLQTLSNRNPIINDLLQLHHAFPELFHATAAATSTSNATPNGLAPASLAQLVIAHEQTYRASAAQLQTVQEVKKDVPDSGTATLGRLVEMQPRIEAVEARQVAQMREYAELRARSARVVEKWYEAGILEMGERWAEWEERIRGCEIAVRRREGIRRREEGAV